MKQIYALTWCYEGVDDNTPSAQTIAVSDSKEKLIAEMESLVALETEELRPGDFDTEEEFEEACWNDDENYEVVRRDETDILLQHRMITGLYVRYRIHPVKYI